MGADSRGTTSCPLDAPVSVSCTLVVHTPVAKRAAMCAHEDTGTMRRPTMYGDACRSRIGATKLERVRLL